MGTTTTPAPGGQRTATCLIVAAIAGAALIVLLFVGALIAAIAIPNFLNAVDRGKQKRTMADMRSIGTAIESYAVDHERYPDAGDVEELRAALEPEFVPSLPTVDGWGNRFVVESSAEGYTLVSPAKGGALDGFAGGPTARFTDDICFSNGSFVQWPEGQQR